MYTYGTLKILIKIEGDQLIIRVGGGYMPFTEFLSTHTQMELEKMKRASVKGPNKRMEIINTLLHKLNDERIISPTKHDICLLYTSDAADE